jgi:hypothetical protein
LIDSAEQHDGVRLAAIFGPQGNAILTSGNVAQDRAEQSEFSQLASTKHQLIVDPRNSNRVILSIGHEHWPSRFPSCVQTGNGASMHPKPVSMKKGYKVADVGEITEDPMERSSP